MEYWSVGLGIYQYSITQLLQYSGFALRSGAAANLIARAQTTP
jgi:hypothetical protein